MLGTTSEPHCPLEEETGMCRPKVQNGLILEKGGGVHMFFLESEGVQLYVPFSINPRTLLISVLALILCVQVQNCY